VELEAAVDALQETAGEESPVVSHPRPVTGGSPERPPRRPNAEKEPYDDIEDDCDICGATGVRLTVVTEVDAEGNRFDMMVCDKCRTGGRAR
jgi:hypothetical protein